MTHFVFGRDQVDRSRYIQALNEAFGRWGDERLYAWVFDRDAGAGLAEQMVAKLDDQWLAGSGVSFRRVRSVSREFTVGIMTGSWTLPAARGRGLFTRIIDESLRITAAHGGEYLLAFVTADNASRRRLEAAGSTMTPTRYVFSPGPWRGSSTDLAWTEIELGSSAVEALRDRAAQRRQSATAFVYPRPEHFRGQFINRPPPVRALESARQDLAIIEEGASTDRVQLLLTEDGDRERALRSLAARAAQRNANLFYFETGDALTDRVPDGMDTTPGFMTVLPATDSSVELDASWVVASGDRM